MPTMLRFFSETRATTIGFVKEVRFLAEIGRENVSLEGRADFLNKATTTRSFAY